MGGKASKNVNHRSTRAHPEGPADRLVEISVVSRFSCYDCATSLGGRLAYDLYPYDVTQLSERNRRRGGYYIEHQISLDDEVIALDLSYSCIASASHESAVFKMGLFHAYEPVVSEMILTEADGAGAVFVYDVANYASWEEAKTLISLVLEQAAKHNNLDLTGRLMLVGCNCDLVEKREVDCTVVREYADRNKMLFMETSAKEDINVEYAFVSFASQLLSDRVTHKIAWIGKSGHHLRGCRRHLVYSRKNREFYTASMPSK